MKIVKVDASGFFLVLIALFVIGGIVFAIFAFRSDPVEETLSGDQVINTLFVIEKQGEALASYVLMYSPSTRKAAVFDIPGSLGLIIPRINRVDRIDRLYDPQRINSFQTEIERLLDINIGFSVVLEMENLVKIIDLIEGVDIFVPIPVEVYYDENISDVPIIFSSGVSRLDGDKARTYISYELPDENSDMPVLRRQRFFLGFLKRLGEQNESLKNSQMNQFFHSFLKTGMNSRARARLFDAFALIDTDRVNIQAVAGLEREISGQRLIFPHWEGELIKDIVRQTVNGLRQSAEGLFSDRVLTVEILNGTPITGLAGRTADLLGGFGYDIIRIGNADRNDYTQTLIIDRSGFPDSARAFGDIIRCRNIQYEAPEPYNTDAETDINERTTNYRADFVLILGRDFNERFVTGN